MFKSYNINNMTRVTGNLLFGTFTAYVSSWFVVVKEE